MKNAMDAEQSGTWVPEITPFIPLILRGKEKAKCIVNGFPS